MVFRADALYAGFRIGDLKLIQRVATLKTGTPTLRKRWRVECVPCGVRLTVPENYLVRTPNPKSDCGGKQHTETFQSRHKPERNVWVMMRTRCYSPIHIGYPSYGGRGIRVCNRWLNDPEGFENFVKDMGRRPKDYTLDRKDPNGHYSPRNCRWVTWDVQNNNQRRHHDGPDIVHPLCELDEVPNHV